MNKNLILIGGAVALLGAGAFMYFKNKKKSDGASSSSSTSPLSEIDKTEVLSESEKVKQDIKDLAVSIKLDRDAVLSLKSQLKPNYRIVDKIKNGLIEKNIANVQNKINSDLAKLKELGYTELNGSAVKIG
jgi:LPXTG-motif cell wall-anchored protein